MKLHRALDQVFGSPVMLRTARALFRIGSSERSGRELAFEAESSPPQTIRALNELESMGLVSKRVVGRSHVWRLEEGHVLASVLRKLFAFEAELPSLFREDLRHSVGRLPVLEVTLFGSVARGTETDQSDADLYIVLSPRASQDSVQAALTPITLRFIQKYGMVISPLIHTQRESSKPENPHLLEAIRADGIPLVGHRNA